MVVNTACWCSQTYRTTDQSHNAFHPSYNPLANAKTHFKPRPNTKAPFLFSISGRNSCYTSYANTALASHSQCLQNIGTSCSIHRIGKWLDWSSVATANVCQFAACFCSPFNVHPPMLTMTENCELKGTMRMPKLVRVGSVRNRHFQVVTWSCHSNQQRFTRKCGVHKCLEVWHCILRLNLAYGWVGRDSSWNWVQWMHNECTCWLSSVWYKRSSFYHRLRIVTVSVWTQQLWNVFLWIKPWITHMKFQLTTLPRTSRQSSPLALI